MNLLVIFFSAFIGLAFFYFLLIGIKHTIDAYKYRKYRREIWKNVHKTNPIQYDYHRVR